MKNIGDAVVMAPFSRFEFSGAGARRNQTLASVMPVNAGLSYAVILTDAYFEKSGSERQIFGYAQLCSEFDGVSVLGALLSARKAGALTEGKKFLPPEMVDFLASYGGPVVHVRADEDGEFVCGEVPAESLKTDIVASQSAATGEFELCDAKGLWYLRFKDDDAVMFFAATSDVVGELSRKLPGNVALVPPDFIYSY